MGKRTLVIYVLLFGFAMSLTPYSIDPFLPAFPAMGEYFGVDAPTIQASFAGVTLGLALGQLLSGPISDAFGRRPLLLAATAGYGLSTLGIFFAPTLEVFVTFRFTMAVFAATADVVARAVIRDLFRGQPMLQMLSRVFLIQALAPIFGPILGSQVVSIGPWQYVFLIVGFFGLVTSFLVWYFLDETLPKAQRRASTAIGILRGFGNVLRDRVYFGLLLTSALQMAALFGYLNVVSYLYQEEFGLSEAEFGLVFALNALAMYLGIQVGGLLSKRFRVQWLMVGFLTVGALTGFYLMATTGSGLWFAEIGFIVLVFVFGAPAAATPTLALLNHGSEAGTASALMGSTNFLATTVFAAIYSTLSLTETFDVGVLIAANFGLATLVLLFVVRPWTIPDLRKPQELPEESH